MRIVNLLVFLGIFSFLLSSCYTSRIVLDVPEQLSGAAQKISVGGVRGSGFPGTKRKIKFDQEYTGTFKNGWRVESSVFDRTPGGIFSEEAFKRGLLSNYGLDVNETSTRQKDKFQFSVSDKQQSVLVFCKQLTSSNATSYRYKDKREISVLNKESSSFTAFISILDEAVNKGWRMEMTNVRENPDGSLFGILQQGMPKETGVLTNGIDSLIVSPVFVRSMGKVTSNASTEQTAFQVVGGYQFRNGEQVVGIVDLFNPTVWLFPSTDNKHKVIITAASTALLLRNR